MNPGELDYAYDPRSWGKKFNVMNDDNINEETVNGFLMFRMQLYKKKRWVKERLWETLKDDFDGWTANIFKQADSGCYSEFRDFISMRGIFVPRIKRPICETLAKVIAEDEYHEWTQRELDAQHEKGGFVWDDDYDSEAGRNKTPKKSGSKKSKKDLSINTSVADKKSKGRKDTSVTTPDDDPDNSSDNSESDHKPTHDDDDKDEHKKTATSGVALPRSLTDLSKLYNENDMKFGGEMFDFLSVKLKIFYDLCSKVGITEDGYHDAVSTMLSGRANKWYYNNLATKGLTFKEMCKRLRTSFETEENRQHYMDMWRGISYRKTINKNPGKDMQECLQILFDDLQKIQPGLKTECQTDAFIRDQVIAACRGVEECSLCLAKPSETFESVCADLRSAVGTQ